MLCIMLFLFFLISFTWQILIADEMLYCNFLSLLGLLYDFNLFLTSSYIQMQVLYLDCLSFLDDDVFWWKILSGDGLNSL